MALEQPPTPVLAIPALPPTPPALLIPATSVLAPAVTPPSPWGMIEGATFLVPVRIAPWWLVSPCSPEREKKGASCSSGAKLSPSPPGIQSGECRRAKPPLTARETITRGLLATGDNLTMSHTWLPFDLSLHALCNRNVPSIYFKLWNILHFNNSLLATHAV